MKIPSLSAAWMTVVPSCTLSSRPSMVNFGMQRLPDLFLLMRLVTTANILFELISEFRDIGLDWPGSRVREDTDGFSFHVTSDREEIVQILRCSPAFSD